MVDWPRAVAPVLAAAVTGAAVVAVVDAAWVAGLSPAALANRLGAAAEVVAEAAMAVVVVVAPGVAAAVVLALPRVGNSEGVGAAVVDDRAAEVVANPRLGKRDFCGVAEDAAVVEGVAAGVPPILNAGLGASPLAAAAVPIENVGFEAAAPVAEGAPPMENAGLGVVSPPVEGAAAPSPNSGLEAGAAVALGVLDSAGLLTLPNKLPPVGVAPKLRGFEVAGVAPAPKRLLVGVCEVVGAVEEGVARDDGVVEEAAFSPPKSAGVLDPGGGPAGVVEVLPNKEPPAGAGVADEAAPPNKLPEDVAAAPPPNNPLVAVCPGVVEPVVWFEVPKEKAEDVPGVLVGAPPALPKSVGVFAPEGAVPKSEGEALPLVAEAPTFPKRPAPLDPVFELV